jgi:hypothetical protein
MSKLAALLSDLLLSEYNKNWCDDNDERYCFGEMLEENQYRALKEAHAAVDAFKAEILAEIRPPKPDQTNEEELPF